MKNKALLLLALVSIQKVVAYDEYYVEVVPDYQSHITGSILYWGVVDPSKATAFFKDSATIFQDYLPYIQELANEYRAYLNHKYFGKHMHVSNRFAAKERNFSRPFKKHKKGYIKRLLKELDRWF